MTFVTPPPVARWPLGMLIIGWLGRNMKAFSIGPFGPLIGRGAALQRSAVHRRLMAARVNLTAPMAVAKLRFAPLVSIGA